MNQHNPLLWLRGPNFRRLPALAWPMAVRRQLDLAGVKLKTQPLATPEQTTSGTAVEWGRSA